MEITNQLIPLLLHLMCLSLLYFVILIHVLLRLKGELTSLNETQNKIYKVLKKNNSIKDEIEK